MKILSAYSPTNRQKHPKCGKTMTEQNHKKACDINTILAKYQKTGLIDHMNQHKPSYGHVSGLDFKASEDLIAQQKTIFYELPATVRKEFDNDPAQYLDLVMTDEGVNKLQNLLNPKPDAEVEDSGKEASEDTQAASKEGETEQSSVT